MSKAKIIILAITFIIIILSYVGYLTISAGLSIKVDLNKEQIHINGVYGQTIKYNDIRMLYLSQVIPEIKKRTNGSDFNGMYKGHFLLSDFGDSLLYIYKESNPYIIIFTKNEYIIINYKNDSETRDLYNKLLEYWEK